MPGSDWNMPENAGTPAEVIAAASCSGPRLSGGQPCEACQGHAERSVAALVEHGYAIAPAAPPRALEASQGLETSEGGIRGPLGSAEASTGLSALHGVEPETHGMAWLHHCGHLNPGGWNNRSVCAGCRFSAEHADEVDAHYVLTVVPAVPDTEEKPNA
ncbi:MAG: hypothetical protein ABR585_07515 [Gemmatimonadaceae bacterium]